MCHSHCCRFLCLPLSATQSIPCWGLRRSSGMRLLLAAHGGGWCYSEWISCNRCCCNSHSSPRRRRRRKKPGNGVRGLRSCCCCDDGGGDDDASRIYSSGHNALTKTTTWWRKKYPRKQIVSLPNWRGSHPLLLLLLRHWTGDGGRDSCRSSCLWSWQCCWMGRLDSVD